MALVNVNGNTVAESLAPVIVGTAVGDAIDSAGKLTGGSFTGLPGEDSITIDGFADNLSGFIVNGNENNDSIDILNSPDLSSATLSDATIYGGRGEDFINVDNFELSNVSIFGNRDDDFINISTGYADNDNFQDINNLLVNGNQGEDIISLVNFQTISDSTIYGGKANDTISISEAFGEDASSELNIANSKINGNRGEDLITIGKISGEDSGATTITNSEIYGGKGDDLIFIGNIGIGEDSNSELNITDSGINGDKGDDLILIGNIGGEDSNSELNITNSEISGGEGDDLIFTGNIGIGEDFNSELNITNSEISGGEGDDLIFTGTINIGEDSSSELNIIDSEIYGGEGDDLIFTGTINIGEDSSGELNIINSEIYGNLGDDTIAIGSIGIGTGVPSIVLDSIGIDPILESSVVITEPVVWAESSVEITIANSEIHGNQGDDSIILGGLFGEDFNEMTISNSGIYAGKDKDSIAIVSVETITNSTFNGGNDNDVIFGSNSSFTDSIISGDSGDDSIIFDSSVDLTNSSVLGGADADYMEIGEFISSSFTFTSFLGAEADADSVIDGGDGDDTIVFAGDFYDQGFGVNRDTTILGGTGADQFQLWNRGEVSLTDFDGTEGDSLILGDLGIKAGTSNSTALTAVNFFQSVSVVTSTFTINQSLLVPNDTIGAVAFTGADFSADVASIFAVNTSSGASNTGFTSSSSTTFSGVQVLYLDTSGTDAGLYVYTVDAKYSSTSGSALVFSAISNTQTQYIALGNFDASDITVI